MLARVAGAVQPGAAPAQQGRPGQRPAPLPVAADARRLNNVAARDHQVAVLGASRKPQRYSNRAVRALKQHGYRVVPVNPAHAEVEGLAAAPSLAEVGGTVDTLTVYIGSRHIAPLIDDIVAARPRRVILNPGTESAELERTLGRYGIPWLEACTLVLLATGQFESALAPAAGAGEVTP